MYRYVEWPLDLLEVSWRWVELCEIDLVYFGVAFRIEQLGDVVGGSFGRELLDHPPAHSWIVILRPIRPQQAASCNMVPSMRESFRKSMWIESGLLIPISAIVVEEHGVDALEVIELYQIGEYELGLTLTDLALHGHAEVHPYVVNIHCICVKQHIPVSVHLRVSVEVLVMHDVLQEGFIFGFGEVIVPIFTDGQSELNLDLFEKCIHVLFSFVFNGLLSVQD